MVNYAAPSLLKVDVTTSTWKLLGHVISSTHGQHSVCLLIMPQFTYKPTGNMFLEEHALLKTLSNLSCNVDLPFQLLFDVKSKVATYFNEYLFGVCLATA